MLDTTDFKLQSFVTINGVTYFRLADGSIAAEKTSNVIIKSYKEDYVYLLTLEFGAKTVRLWDIQNKLYALASSSYVELPINISFMDIYSSDNYPDGVYVKYKYLQTNTYGIIYVSETEVRSVIEHDRGYLEIDFENGMFYAKTEAKYHIIEETGKIINISETKCEKVAGYKLFYDESKIYAGDASFEVPDEILTVEVVKVWKMTFVRVVTKKGIYYYTKVIAYLLGPIKADKMLEDTETSCYICEVVNGKNVQVFHIAIANDTYQCTSIACENGITIYANFLGIMSDRFFATDKELYFVGKSENDFRLLLTDVEADSYIFINRARELGRHYEIVAFKKQKPVYWAYYCTMDKEIFSHGKLEIICDGWSDGSYICKLGDLIIIIVDGDKIIFSDYGEKCDKKKLRRKSGKSYEVYVVEIEPDVIEIYDSNGQRI